MKRFIFASAFIISCFSFAKNSTQKIAARCTPDGSTVPSLYSSDFHWHYSLPELIHRFTEIYKSPKQLSRKAYWDPTAQKIKLPYAKLNGGDVEITESFVNSVARHIERAFQLEVIDGVFFPDMGHSHLLIPDQLYETKYSDYPVTNFKGFYEQVFQDPELRILYHTAEQLNFLDADGQLSKDPRIRFRHRTRNIVGDNHAQSELQFYENSGHSHNTVGEVDGYRWWGAGFNLSANQKGCFEYQHRGETFYFDLSLYDLEPET